MIIEKEDLKKMAELADSAEPVPVPVAILRAMAQELREHRRRAAEEHNDLVNDACGRW